MNNELEELRERIAMLPTADRYLLAELILTDTRRVEARERAEFDSLRDDYFREQRAEIEAIRTEEAAALKGAARKPKEGVRAAG